MRKLSVLLLLIFFTFSVAAQSPTQTPATHLLNDYAGLLTKSEAQQVTVPQKELYDQGKVQYAIVIVNSTHEYDIAQYAYEVAEGNLGDQVANNGLLLLIAIEDQRYRFEVGRGLEATLPDLLLAQIAQNHLEHHFAAGEYAQGLLSTNLAIQAVIDEDVDSSYYAQIPQQSSHPVIEFIARNPILTFFILMIIISAFSKKKGRNDDDLLNALILGSMLGRGGKGGFGGSGGFGGFGGGSFGGGGFSGGWGR